MVLDIRVAAGRRRGFHGSPRAVPSIHLAPLEGALAEGGNLQERKLRPSRVPIWTRTVCPSRLRTS